MQKPDKKIIDFFHEHHVFTLATCVDGNPWCASLFYAYLEDENIIVFTSEAHTRHIHDVMKNNLVAGTVSLETKKIGLIRGVQFQGLMTEPDSGLREKAKRAYLTRFPYALLKPAPLWIISFHTLKFTDNRLGFGKKLLWEKE
jgi:uncharacterized protein YhbP (UPF0306 family)